MANNTILLSTPEVRIERKTLLSLSSKQFFECFICRQFSPQNLQKLELSSICFPQREQNIISVFMVTQIILCVQIYGKLKELPTFALG